jgi:hypothetical protein
VLAPEHPSIAGGETMAEQKVYRLRQQAEHCRRLALSLCDEPTIVALLEMAQEYEEKADLFEGKPWQGN